MHARFQQFFYANTDHKFPLLRARRRAASHSAENGIDFSVIVATGTRAGIGKFLRPFNPPGNRTAMLTVAFRAG